jgi:hypothetical protein
MLQARRSRVRFSISTKFLNLSNPSSLAMALGLSQPLTKITTRNIPVQPARKAHKLTANCQRFSYKM